MRKVKKSALLAVLSGTTMFGGLGCLGGNGWAWLWQGAGLSLADHAMDSLVLDNLFLGQDAAHAVAFGDAVLAICDGRDPACIAAYRP